MSDFVVELRPRFNNPPQTYTPTYSPGDFVAEIRPRSNTHSEFRHFNSQCHDLDFNDQELQSILSDTHFSRERITRLLEGSILTLVEKLMTGRPLSRVDGRLCVSLSGREAPIVVNFNKILSHHNTDETEQSLEGSFNVKVKHGDVSPMMCHKHDRPFAASSPLHEFERDTCHSMAETEENLSYHSEYYREGERSLSSPPCDLQHSPSSSTPREIESFSGVQIQSCEPKTQEVGRTRHESDDESGYTSNDKDDSDTACERTGGAGNSYPQKPITTFNDYYCNGFDGKNTLYTSDEKHTKDASLNKIIYNSPTSSRKDCDEMEDDEEDKIAFDNRLVINECLIEDRTTSPNYNAQKDTKKLLDQAMEVDEEKSNVSNEVNIYVAQNGPHRKAEHQECLHDDIEDLDSLVSSDITDTDVRIEFSGDSKFPLDVVSALPHPQSLVSKHPEGFRCKQCAHILADATAVSEHAQSKHDLFCCNYCCRTFTAKNNLKRHIRIHTGHRPYKCSQCSQSFSRRDGLKGHMMCHDYSKPFRCSLCKKGYTDRACVKNHMAKEHRSRLMHVCPQCGESYDQEEAFTAHKKTHPELQQFSCDTCSFIGNNNLMTQKHALLHSRKLFSCKPCNAYFADPFDYTNHVRKHKKLPDFSQYICCFCDLALPTYDQFVRHEYSHAQGKTHICKTCKKMFKSKSLLQDHTLCHEEHEFDKAEAGPMRTIEADIQLWQPKEVRNISLVIPSIESTFTDDYSNRSGGSHSEEQERIVYSTDPKVEDQDEFQGQLLDLSLKKPRDQNVDMKDPCNDPISFGSGLRLTGLGEQNGPRNGVVKSESFSLGQGHEVSEIALSFQRSKTDGCDERICKPTFAIQENNDSLRSTDFAYLCSNDQNPSRFSLNTVNSSTTNFPHLDPTKQTRPKSAGRSGYSIGASFKEPVRGQLHRTVSQEHSRRASVRFGPYSKERIADLAAKFVAARGTDFFQQRVPLNHVIPHCENRKETVTPSTDTKTNPLVLAPSRWQLDSTLEDMPGLVHKPLLLSALASSDNRMRINNDKVVREELNPETALRYHAPIVVKSESTLGQGQVVEASGKFQVSAPENESNANPVPTKHWSLSYECEDCLTRFESFSELESHSVDIHKRYLCEHCKKSFTARPNRDRHVRYHTGERPYKCDLCDLAFFRGDDLKYHRTTRHPTAQPFVCTLCSASFTWSRDLDRHIRHSKCHS